MPDLTRLVSSQVLVGPTLMPVANGAVLVEDGRLVAVGIDADVPAPAGCRRYDLGAATLMLGLIDAPTHPLWKAATEFVPAVQWGMAPTDALAAGTLIGAEALGMAAETGSLDVGKRADIVAVAGDPLREITAMKRPVFVMKQGCVVRTPAAGERRCA